MINRKAVLPCIKAWHQVEQQRAESGFYRQPVRSVGRMRWVWYAVIVGILAAAAMDGNHRKSQAAYRNLPSADEKLLSGDYPLTDADREAEQARIITREFGKIAGM